MAANNTRSEIWQYFTVGNYTDEIAICSLCENGIKRGSGTKSFSTTPLWNHFKSAHPTDYSIFKKCKTTETEFNSSVNQEKTPDFSKNFMHLYETTKEKCIKSTGVKQPTCSETNERRKGWDINDTRSRAIHEKIMQMIALDHQPLTITENDGFRDLITHLQPQYSIPSCKYFSETVLPEMYENLRSAIQNRINPPNGLFVSFTLDTWTWDTSNQTFISLSAHWIDEDFIRNYSILEVANFPSSRTTVNISNMIEEMCNNWKIDRSRRHVLVSDGVANMAAESDFIGIDCIHCTIHLLQLVIKDCINSERSISDLLVKFQRIASYFDHSPSACTELQKLQMEVDVNSEPVLPMRDSQTHWNSSYLMVKRMVRLKGAMELYQLRNNNLPTIEIHEWQLCDNLLFILHPFFDLTLEMSSGKSYISSVIPNIATLELFLIKIDQKDQGVQSIKEKLLNNLRIRFFNDRVSQKDTQDLTKTSVNILNNKTYATATIIDPRYKTCFFKNNAQKDQAMSWVLEDFVKSEHVKNIVHYDQSNSSPSMSSDSTDVLSPNKKAKKSSDMDENLFKSCFEEIVGCSSLQTNEQDIDDIPNILLAKDQLKKYLKLPLLKRKSDPLEWWKNNKDFPLLKNLSRKVLSTPLFTVHSERQFSEFGNRCEEKRNHLLTATNEKLIFIHHNVKKYNSN